MMHTRTMLAGGAVALAAGLVATAVLLWFQPSPPAAAASARPIATAEVTRGTLVDTKTVAGTLSHGELSALRPSLADASAMVTWIAPVGSIVQRGEPLYTLDGQPAILFYGAMPLHRTLRFDLGVPSPVWVELQQAGTVAEAAELTLGLEEQRLAEAEARMADVKVRLDDALSSAPATPEFIQLAGAMNAARDKVGRIRELSAAELTPIVEIAAAEAEFATARAAFDAAIRALRGDIAAAGLDAATARLAVAEAVVKRDTLRRALGALAGRASDSADVEQLAENLAALGYEGALAEQVRAWQQDAGLSVTGVVDPSQLVLAEGPVHIAERSANIGETLIASSADHGSILNYSSTQKLVTVPLDVGDQALAAVGRVVSVTLPDDTEVGGTIAEVGSVVTDDAIVVTIAIADQAALGGLEVASVDVEFVSDSRDDVLSVPIAALLARPEGGFAVEVTSSGGGVLVPVDTGLFAAGRVEVTGEGIAEGMRVGVPG